MVMGQVQPEPNSDSLIFGGLVPEIVPLGFENFGPWPRAVGANRFMVLNGSWFNYSYITFLHFKDFINKKMNFLCCIQV